MKSINIFGVTGSIGLSSIKVLEQYKEIFSINAISAGNNVELLAEIAIKFKVKYAVIANISKFTKLKSLLLDYNIKTDCGESGLLRIAEQEVDICLSAIVGYAGLKPTMHSLKYAKCIALANKESLVIAGELFISKANKYKCKILPIDSEHSAIFQCLQGNNPNEIEKILLTSSGGSFRKYSIKEMEYITVTQALQHPNWNMGSKITIDSATLMNKGNEIIEAFYLFPISLEQIEIIIHKQSIIHSMIQYCDGAIIAQLGTPEMSTAIAYAISWPNRMKLNFKRLDLIDIAELSFEKPDEKRFKCLNLAKNTIKQGGTCAAVLNAANEIAVDAFLNNQISFLSIANICEETINKAQSNGIITSIFTLDDLYEVNKIARSIATSLI